MFQPQPTPFSPYASSYGVVTDDVGYNFPPASLVLDSGGPIVFDNPTFNPVGSQYLPLNINNSNANPIKFNAMETPPEDDMAAQEALARQYQPDLKVGGSIALWEKARLTGRQGPLVGIKKSSQAITEEYAKADPVYVAKTEV